MSAIPSMSDADERTATVKAYKRILKAADKGHGCSLSHVECVAIAADSAVQTMVSEYDLSVQRRR